MNWESLTRIAVAALLGVSFAVWLLGLAAVLIEANYLVKPPAIETRR